MLSNTFANMFKISQAVSRATKNNIAFHIIRVNSLSSAPPPVEVKTVSLENNEESNVVQSKPSYKELSTTSFKPNSNIVAAAFASLKSEQMILSNDIKTPFMDSKIAKANTVNELLSLSDGIGVSRKHALKVVSMLADWSSTGKVRMSEFETDPRFIKLCKILTKGVPSSKPIRSTTRGEDLSTILSVTADDEAAKLIAGITLPQMIKVMSTLANKKRRSISLLRALAFNITKSPEKLDLKQSADILYSMAVLNFPDETLLERIANDVCQCLDANTKRSAVVGSILTSLGLLKYKEPSLLEALSGWILKYNSVCRPQDIFSLFHTLAVLNFEPDNFEKLYVGLIQQLTMEEANKPTTWLDLVWSLVVLNKATKDHISSVLSEEFVKRVKDESPGISSSLKLMNIDAAAEYLIKDYNGPRLKNEVKALNISRSKEKEEMVGAVLDSLKNLLHSETYLKGNVDAGMGFYIDAVCVMDKKCNPIAIDKATEDHVKIAVMVNDYHDMCKGKIEQTGINALTSKLLEVQGYKILTVPYTDFKPREKLVDRVKYIESKLKTLANS